jgi:hypothetical protein
MTSRGWLVQARLDLVTAIDAQNRFNFERARMAMEIVSRHLRMAEDAMEKEAVNDNRQ